MSIRVMQAVFDHSESRGNARLVMLAIADSCHDDGTGCWRGKDSIAARAKVDRATATRQIKVCEELGELVVTRRDGRTSEYQIVLPGIGDQAQPAPGSAPDAPGGGRTVAPGGGAPVRRDTSLNHPDEPSAPPFGGDAVKAEADRITRTYWEAVEPKPMIVFPALRAIVETALRSHWPPRDVRAAMDDCETFTKFSLEKALKRRSPKRGPGGAPIDNSDLA